MRKILALVVLIVAICTGCGAAGTYRHLTPEDAQKIIDTESDVIILDVRTPEEYAKSHIPDAVLLPVEEIRQGNFALLPDKNQKILVYCWTGRRAGEAAKILVENGYKNICEFGGLVDWNGALVGNDS